MSMLVQGIGLPYTYCTKKYWSIL